MKNITTLGDRAKLARQAAKLSQMDVESVLSGFDRFQLMRLEKNEYKNPPIELISQLVKLYGVTRDWMECGTGPMEEWPQVAAEPEAPYYVKRSLGVMEMLDEYARQPSVELKDAIKNEIYRLQQQVVELQGRLLERR